MSGLREDQIIGIGKARLGWRAGFVSQMIVAPPGAGKTHTALEIIKSAAAKGHRAFFIVDELHLLNHVVDLLQRDGIYPGVIQADHPLTDISKPVQICMIQSLGPRWETLMTLVGQRPDVIISDEAHVLYEAHKRIIADCRKYLIPYLGLSATPFTPGLGHYFDNLIVLSTASDLIARGLLVPTLVKAPYIPNLRDVPTHGGRPDSNWIERELSRIMGDKHVFDDTVKHWIEYGENRKTLGYAVNISEARAYAQEFYRCGIEADFIDSQCDPIRAYEKLQAYERGDIEMIWSVSMLIKAFDSPSTSCIVDCGPTKSSKRHFQKMGRGARIAPWLGKKNLLYFDHAGNVLRHGLPTDPMPYELDQGSSKSKNNSRTVLQSKQSCLLICFACRVLSRGEICNNCGACKTNYDRPAHVESDLSWYRDDPFKTTSKEKELLSADDLQHIYSGLLGYALTTHKEACWVAKAFKKRTQIVLPDFMKIVEPGKPDPQLSLWIMSYNIKNTKYASSEQSYSKVS